MIKKIKGSLTIKICIFITILLIASSGITYAVISKFLPVYYSSQLEQDLDRVSQEMAETISSLDTLGDAFSAIELFQAGSQVSVVILDAKGTIVWPVSDTAVIEESIELEDNIVEQYRISDFAIENYTDETGMAYVRNVEEATDSVESADSVETVETVDKEAVWDEEVTYDEDIQNMLENWNMNSAVKHYDLKVGDDDYMMIVSGGMQPVNQAMEILHQMFPYILGVSAVTAVLFALAASLYLTVPIVRLSGTSKKMAALDFSNRYPGKRTDEIGILGRSLNELSANLSRTLEELQQANEKLKSDIEMEREMEKKRIEFFSAVSHELKTPITILKGHLSGMLQGVGDYKNREYYLKRSQQTAEKMETMVQELLTISRIENNTFIRQKTDIAEQLRQQLAEMTELMEEKGLQLIAELPEHLEAEVNANMMEKVFCNLLMNAICYTPGHKNNEIRVRLDMSMQDNKKIFCSVENTGVFIPQDDMSHLFEAFYRVEQSRNRQTGGSGLGLYIVRMVLEQHGAEYMMENTEEGVKFSFLLPEI